MTCSSQQGRDAAVRSLRSVVDQTLPCDVVAVVDHDGLLARLRSLTRTEPALADVRVLRSAGPRGPWGARNTGVWAATTPLVAFLDGDVLVGPRWAEELVAAVGPGAVGAGGVLLPAWDGGAPAWFPPELGWALGASVPGDGQAPSPVRAVRATSMLVRRDAFERVGGFRAGADPADPAGAAVPPDTEVCLRTAEATGGAWLLVPRAVGCREVPPGPATRADLLRRCWAAAREQAPRPGPGAPPAPARAAARHLLDGLRGDPRGVDRAVMAVAGAVVAAAGRRRRPPAPAAPGGRVGPRVEPRVEPPEALAPAPDPRRMA